jgi:hypothetical protein
MSLLLHQKLSTLQPTVTPAIQQIDLPPIPPEPPTVLANTPQTTLDDRSQVDGSRDII